MNLLRWTARTLSILVILYHILSFLGDIRSSVTLTTLDKTDFALWAIILLGMLVAWKWEVAGGLIIIGGFLIQAILNPLILSTAPMWIAPFIGMLFLVCGFYSRKNA